MNVMVLFSIRSCESFRVSARDQGYREFGIAIVLIPALCVCSRAVLRARGVSWPLPLTSWPRTPS